MTEAEKMAHEWWSTKNYQNLAELIHAVAERTRKEMLKRLAAHRIPGSIGYEDIQVWWESMRDAIRNARWEEAQTKEEN